eukprot:gene2461-3226_t
MDTGPQVWPSWARTQLGPWLALGLGFGILFGLGTYICFTVRLASSLSTRLVLVLPSVAATMTAPLSLFPDQPCASSTHHKNAAIPGLSPFLYGTCSPTHLPFPVAGPMQMAWILNFRMMSVALRRGPLMALVDRPLPFIGALTMRIVYSPQGLSFAVNLPLDPVRLPLPVLVLWPCGRPGQDLSNHRHMLLKGVGKAVVVIMCLECLKAAGHIALVKYSFVLPAT